MASGDTTLSSPCWDPLATMRRVVNYHSSCVWQRQVELFDASGNRVWCKYERRSVQISPAFNVSDQTSPVCCAISDKRVVLQTSPAFGFAFRLLLRVLRDKHWLRSPIPFYVSRTLEHCSAVSSSTNSHHFRPPFFTFEVALDSSREAPLIDISFGGCFWLERDREAAPVIRSAVLLLCSGFNQFSGTLLVVIVAQNQDLSVCRDVLLAFLLTGAYCLAGSFVLVFPLDSSPGSSFRADLWSFAGSP
ncbi:P-type ATPase (ISS) [Dorcoceras hygrometricum]|uniref:P-type ATPase (ISS) n=1 Tax=Dorcoceras hygrometricum TaxID=472368 RepID=A0A2Z7D3S8_9LAMI|nr:P-type ATPase (ISS) [Dorcoceras hygrometricum]